MRRNRFFIIAATIMAAASITGCSSSTPSKMGEITTQAPVDTASQTETPDTSLEPGEQLVTVFYGDTDREFILSKQVATSDATGLGISDQLVSIGWLNDDVDLNDMEVTFDKKQKKVVYLDYNSALKRQFSGLSENEEYVMMGSIVNTFLVNESADYVSLKVDGKVFETSNNKYNKKLEYYPVCSNDRVKHKITVDNKNKKVECKRQYNSAGFALDYNDKLFAYENDSENNQVIIRSSSMDSFGPEAYMQVTLDSSQQVSSSVQFLTDQYATISQSEIFGDSMIEAEKVETYDEGSQRQKCFYIFAHGDVTWTVEISYSKSAMKGLKENLDILTTTFKIVE